MAEKEDKKTSKRTTLSIYLMEDNPFDKAILDAIENHPKIGTNKSGLAKQVLYDYLVANNPATTTTLMKNVSEEPKIEKEENETKDFVNSFKNKIR